MREFEQWTDFIVVKMHSKQVKSHIISKYILQISTQKTSLLKYVHNDKRYEDSPKYLV